MFYKSIVHLGIVLIELIFPAKTSFFKSQCHIFFLQSTSTEKIMTLKIDRIFKQHFRTYFFEAGNELGKESHEIELVRGTFCHVIDQR